MGFSHFFVVISLARAFCTQQAPSVTLQPSKAWHLNQQTAQTIKRRFLRLFGPTLTHLHTPPPPSYIKKCTNKGYLLKRRTNIPPFIDFLTEKKCSDLPPICTPCMGRCQLAQYLSKKILTSQESHWPVVTGQNNLRAPIGNEGVIRPYNQWLYLALNEGPYFLAGLVSGGRWTSQ